MQAAPNLAGPWHAVRDRLDMRPDIVGCFCRLVSVNSLVLHEVCFPPMVCLVVFCSFPDGVFALFFRFDEVFLFCFLFFVFPPMSVLFFW